MTTHTITNFKFLFLDYYSVLVNTEFGGKYFNSITSSCKQHIKLILLQKNLLESILKLRSYDWSTITLNLENQNPNTLFTNFFDTMIGTLNYFKIMKTSKIEYTENVKIIICNWYKSSMSTMKKRPIFYSFKTI